jgi:hypothetical protein
MWSEHLVYSNSVLLFYGTLLSNGQWLRYGRSNTCMIMHNIITESERANPMHDDHPYDWESALAQVDHQVLADFKTFLQRQHEIGNKHVHQPLHDNLVAHLWTSRGNAT